MSFGEKLQVIETIWDDLSRNPERFESPSWHKDILEETDRRIVSGEARFVDWEKAKVEIRNRLQ